MGYVMTVRLAAPYDEAVRRVRDALAEQGFGVLTEIDVTATMRQKLDVEMEPYLILGACNPPLAHRALEAERSIGALLPCNVVVRGDGDGSVVEFLDPETMVTLTGDPAVKAVADEAGTRLRAALGALAA